MLTLLLHLKVPLLTYGSASDVAVATLMFVLALCVVLLVSAQL
jgi:hypothetical protein